MKIFYIDFFPKNLWIPYTLYVGELLGHILGSITLSALPNKYVDWQFILVLRICSKLCPYEQRNTTIWSWNVSKACAFFNQGKFFVLHALALSYQVAVKTLHFSIGNNPPKNSCIIILDETWNIVSAPDWTIYYKSEKRCSF